MRGGSRKGKATTGRIKMTLRAPARAIGVVLALALLSSAPALAQSDSCDNVPPRTFPIDCDEYAKGGHCETRKELRACRHSCGLCLDEKDERAVQGVQRSIFHCGMKTREHFETSVLADFLSDARALREGLDLWSLFDKPEVLEVVRNAHIGCVAETYAFQSFLDLVLPTVASEDLRSLSPKNVSDFVSSFFKKGCNADQLIGFLPKVAELSKSLRREDGSYVQESRFLLQLYESEYDYKGTEVGFTQETIDGSPALSVCLSSKSSLKILLQVRECHDEYGGRHCHRGKRSTDPLPLPTSMLYRPPRQVKAEEKQDGRNSNNDDRRRRRGRDRRSRGSVYIVPSFP